MPVRVFFSGARRLDCSRQGSVIKGEATINKLRFIEWKGQGWTSQGASVRRRLCKTDMKGQEGGVSGARLGKEIDSNEGLVSRDI